MADWTTLDELPAGTLFETEDGAVALKTEYNTTQLKGDATGNAPDCYLSGSGERFDYADERPEEIFVRPIHVDLSASLNHHDRYTLAVVGGGQRFGKLLSTDDRGIWFCGKMERDNPKEKERTYFVPWTSIVWLEMEES